MTWLDLTTKNKVKYKWHFYKCGSLCWSYVQATFSTVSLAPVLRVEYWCYDQLFYFHLIKCSIVIWSKNIFTCCQVFNFDMINCWVFIWFSSGYIFKMIKCSILVNNTHLVLRIGISSLVSSMCWSIRPILTPHESFFTTNNVTTKLETT